MLFRKNLVRCFGDFFLFSIEEVSFMIFVEVPNYYPIFYLTFNKGF